MGKQRKLLAVFAHPDDETFICGGTLSRYAKEGAAITLISATKGEMGRRMGKPPFVNRETMPKLREKELMKACEHLEIQDLRFLGIRDKTVEYANFEELVGRIVGIIREIEPEVVLTFHEKLGGHPDHCAIGLAAIAAFRQSGDPSRYNEQLKEGLRPYASSKLYFVSFGDAMKQPEKYGLSKDQITQIDVSCSTKEKMLAFRAHRCQTELDEWLWGPDNKVLQHFGKYEYFIQGEGRRNAGETDLFAATTE